MRSVCSRRMLLDLNRTGYLTVFDASSMRCVDFGFPCFRVAEPPGVSAVDRRRRPSPSCRRHVAAFDADRARRPVVSADGRENRSTQSRFSAHCSVLDLLLLLRRARCGRRVAATTGVYCVVRGTYYVTGFYAERSATLHQLAESASRLPYIYGHK